MTAKSAFLQIRKTFLLATRSAFNPFMSKMYLLTGSRKERVKPKMTLIYII